MSEKQAKEETAEQAKARRTNPSKPADDGGEFTLAPLPQKGKPDAKPMPPSAKGTGASPGPTAKLAKAKAVAKSPAAAGTEPAAAESPEPHFEPPHHWLSREKRQMGFAILVAAVFVGSVIIVLGLWKFAVHLGIIPQEIVAEVVDEPQEELQKELDTELTPTTELSTESTSVADHVGAMGDVSAMAEPQVDAVTSDTPTEVSVKVGNLNVMAATGTKLAQGLPSGSLKGDAGVVADSYAQAMDRITQEILNKLTHGKLLVVWLMDESESMNDDREDIMSRIGKVYQELGLAEQAKGDALLTAVASYGQNWTNHSKRPTSNVDEIVQSMSAVVNDPSGLEMMCPAIIRTIQEYRKVPRPMVLIVVTDESGDPATNTQYLESAIAEAKASRCPIYFLGREAIFGYPYATMRWADPKSGAIYHLPIDRGPETAYPEQLQIDGLRTRTDALPSGFGPYEQCRLVRETNGIFFMLPSPETGLVNRDLRKYGPNAMRAYLPDLNSREEYAAERDSHPMRGITWKVISDLNPYNPNVRGKLEMKMGFSNDPAVFAQQAKEAMEQAANVIMYLHEAQLALEGCKAEREQESNYRWRANYDLILAQTIAYQVRLHEYGTYLSEFIQTPKPVVNMYGALHYADRWGFKENPRFITGDKYKDMVNRATDLFKQVIADNPDTPWAARAEMELNRPYGFEFYEGHRAVPAAPRGGGPAPKF